MIWCSTLSTFIPMRRPERLTSLFSDNQGDLNIPPKPIPHVTFPSLSDPATTKLFTGRKFAITENNSHQHSDVCPVGVASLGSYKHNDNSNSSSNGFATTTPGI